MPDVSWPVSLPFPLRVPGEVLQSCDAGCRLHYISIPKKIYCPKRSFHFKVYYVSGSATEIALFISYLTLLLRAPIDDTC